MSLMRWEPFRSLRRREGPFDDLFREFFRQPILEDADGSRSTPPGRRQS